MAAHSKPAGLLSLLFTLLVVLQATVAVRHGSHHAHRSPDAIKAHLAERANNIAITGVTGTAAARLEIRDLAQNADAYNLFLLGLERFQGKDYNDRMSFYQIAGVHGVPFVTWNNFPTPLVNNAGFCPHGNILFGSWHRPYLAIFEQAWYQSVQEVISTFPSDQQQRWRNAANGLRHPYLDWAKFPGSGQPAIPTLIRDKYVTVTKPSGQVSIPNPLYSYTFAGNQLPAAIGSGPWDNWPTTLRRPVSNPTRSNNNEMNDRFGSIRISLRDRVYSLFMTGASWGFASTSAIGVRTAVSGNNVDSFESVHDAIHSTAGGESGGHMWFLDYSSFDPFFWLHHYNVDRLLAMYQIITPDTYVANGQISRPMAQWNQGEEKNSNTPLKPFTKNTNGDYFTSNDVKDTRVLGYFYPETAGNPNADAIRSAVTNLYGPNSPTRKRSVGGQYEGRPFKQGDYQTVLSVIANKFGMDGSLAIHCFLGKSNSTATSSNSSSTDFTLDSNYVGMYAVAGGSKALKNSTYPVMTEGSLPLTTALQGKEASGELKSLHPEDTVPYLKQNLYYRVFGPNGEVPADKIPDLHISVKSSPITVANSTSEFPKLGAYTVHPEATVDKPAGKPFTYVPTPIDQVSDGTQPGLSYPTGVFPYPTAPESEPGYCVSKQVIKYVDPAGNFLYQEVS